MTEVCLSPAHIIYQVPPTGIEPVSLGFQASANPSQLSRDKAGHEGFEPSPNSFGDCCATVTPMTYRFSNRAVRGIRTLTPALAMQCAKPLNTTTT